MTISFALAIGVLFGTFIKLDTMLVLSEMRAQVVHPLSSMAGVVGGLLSAYACYANVQI